MESEENKKERLGFWDFCDKHPFGTVIVAICICDVLGKIASAFRQK